MNKADFVAARDARRKARAIAYLQEKPPKGQGWTQKKTPYVYDREDDDAVRTQEPC